ncbi:MAG: glycerate kinase [candidate division Zixibacteria bacterium SM23_81]|nr:MAG: glycerate kinase [candidate division Zixibacteria bacterium SM23_81]
MKIIAAPNAFKESLSAVGVAQSIARGVHRVIPRAEVVQVPMADGGDGTVEALVAATGGRIIKKRVTGPLDESVEAYFGLLGDGHTAVVEMATASGLHLVPKNKRNPMKTTTYGTGELIAAALDQGAKKVIVGIGGSATVDGGAGMAQALGCSLLEEGDRDIPRGGQGLALLSRVDISKRHPALGEVKTVVACDVDNPLTGPQGAPAVYGPQKGATPEMVRKLDEYLTNYARILKTDLGLEVDKVPGAGAAGGLGAGLMAFLGAQLKSGVEIVIEASKLEQKLAGADLVITGEGKLDGQTAFGKAPVGVSRLAKKHGIPVVAIGGALADDAHEVLDHGIDAIFSIVPRPIPLEEAMKRTDEFVTQTTEQIVRLVLLKVER